MYVPMPYIPKADTTFHIVEQGETSETSKTVQARTVVMRPIFLHTPLLGMQRNEFGLTRPPRPRQVPSTKTVHEEPQLFGASTITHEPETPQAVHAPSDVNTHQPKALLKTVVATTFYIGFLVDGQTTTGKREIGAALLMTATETDLGINPVHPVN